jgi:hypothetical protein
MSSGHSAGLQSVAQFRITENKIQGQKRQDTNELTPGSTVYRDKDGKVLTVSDSAQNPKNNIENDGTWNVGTKQRQDALDRAAEMQSISQSTVARAILQEKVIRWQAMQVNQTEVVRKYTKVRHRNQIGLI